MKYYIVHKDGRYMKQEVDGTFHYVSKSISATTFTEAKAKNIINNQIALTERKYLSLKEICDKDIKEANKDDAGLIKINHKLIDRVDTMLSGLVALNNLCNGISELESNLQSELSTVDSEITDIEHYVEQNTLNAVAACKTIKLLHQALNYRREVKDSLIKVGILKHNTNNFDQNINKQIEGLNNRQYTPRVLTELFNDKK